MSNPQDKIRALPTSEGSELAKAVSKMEREHEMIVAHHIQIAKIQAATAPAQRAAYLAYIKEGFTAKQALELIIRGVG